jgi:hypothetical protein
VSIKDELNYVKTELSADEKVLESAFRLESFLKRHKNKLVGVAIAAIAGTIAYNGYAFYEASKLEAANGALLTLQRNPNDKSALSLLKENAPRLYEHFILQEAAEKGDVDTVKVLETSGNEVVADMSRYSAAVLQRKTTNSTLYRELALLEEAYAALKRGDRETAIAKLELIDERSPASGAAMLLRHAALKVR